MIISIQVERNELMKQKLKHSHEHIYYIGAYSYFNGNRDLSVI
jgi:hypothetical protein